MNNPPPLTSISYFIFHISYFISHISYFIFEAQTATVYAYRTPRRYCDHCHSGGNAAPGIEQSQKIRDEFQLHEQYAAAGTGNESVHQRFQ